MLKIRFIVVDPTKSAFIRRGQEFYLDRIKGYTRMDWIEVKGTKIKKGIPEREILLQEGRALARRIRPGDYVVALDRTGTQYGSRELAQWVGELSRRINGWACFIIGGPLGLSEEILEKADKRLSLSRLTLTHEMTRLLLTEQIYRAFTILKGEKYHK